MAAFFEQIPAIAKNHTSKLFVSEEDGSYYPRLYNPQTEPLQLVLAVTALRRVCQVRELLIGGKNVSSAQHALGWLPETCLQLPDWLPHADFFIAALIAHRFFNPHHKRDMEYVRKFKDWLGSDETSFKAAYGLVIAAIEPVVASKQDEYGYSHPAFFKSQSEYNSLRKGLPIEYRTF